MPRQELLSGDPPPLFSRASPGSLSPPQGGPKEPRPPKEPEPDPSGEKSGLSRPEAERQCFPAQAPGDTFLLQRPLTTSEDKAGGREESQRRGRCTMGGRCALTLAVLSALLCQVRCHAGPPGPRSRVSCQPGAPAACGVAARRSGRLCACRALPRAGAPTGPRSPGRQGCKPAVAPSPRPDPPSDALLREIFLCCFAFVSLVWREQEGRGLMDSRRWPDHRGRGVTLGAAGPYRGLSCAPTLGTFATFAFEQMQMSPCKIQKA